MRMLKWLFFELLFLAVILGVPMLHARQAATQTEELRTELGVLRTALTIYYGDQQGKYPVNLGELTMYHKYLKRPPRGVDIYATVPGRGVMRVHTRQEMEKVSSFGSSKQADDTGGWGYVNDPRSPEYGLVFVNCTHREPKKKTLWYLE